MIDLAQVLARPPDFGLDQGPDSPEWIRELFKTWALGPVITHRDTGPLQDVNAEVIQERLNACTAHTGRWNLFDASHWAVGHCTHLSYQVLDGGEITETAKFLAAQFELLSLVQCLDTPRLMKRLQAETIETLTAMLGRIRTKALQKDLPKRVFNWLKKNRPESVRFSSCQSAEPEEAVVREALAALR